ncbi:MAG: hypothetical protein HXK70_05010 [Clostridiales bacterium]|nr:hypothetical protein [Clostridiales bacterium]
MIKEILKQIAILLAIIITILLVTFLVSDKDVYKDIYVIDITLSTETNISKLEEDTKRVLEDNTIRVKQNGIFKTSLRIISYKEITTENLNKLKEQVINFVDRDAKTKEVKLIPKENLFLNMDIYMMNFLSVILVTALCTVMLKVITKKLEEN